jgi:hypothetical protein
MKYGRNFRRTVAITGSFLAFLTGADLALADQFQVVPTSSSEFGNPYGEWSARWWQWILSIPEAKNPGFDTKGTNCAEGQTGQVWFLAGTFVEGAVTRSCTIPAGKDLFFPILNAIFGQGVGDCTGPGDCDPTALRKSAAARVDNPQLLEITIDSVGVINVDRYRVTSPVFSAFFPQGAIFGLDPGTHSPLVSDGYWLLVKPLSQGQHTIHIKAVFSNGDIVDVTYVLKVKK